MPIHGYPGGVITANPVAPTASVATGVWTTEQQLQAVSQGNWPGYEYPISRSLRFNSADSAYLNRTLSSSGDMKVFTLSFWLKRTALGVINNLFTVRNAIGSGTEYFQIKYNANDTISVIGRDSGSVVRCNVSSTAVFRDPGAWANIVISFNASSTTLNVYANNVVIANSTSIGNVNYGWNNSSLTYHRIGDGALVGEANLNGYMAELYHVDGQALTPSSFGLNDPETGVWSPKRYTGTYGINGFYLNFSDNSGTTSTTLGKDSSGNGNNWTPNNFSVTAGAGNDSLVDSPTSYGTDTGVGGEVRGNYCTWSAIDKASDCTLANGNLDVTTTNAPADNQVRGTIGVSSGKWYWEMLVNTTSNATMLGIVDASVTANTGVFPGTTAITYGYYGNNGNKYNNNTSSAYGNTYGSGDVIGCALDLDNGKIWWSKNGTWQASGDPAAGTNAAYTGVSGTKQPAAADVGGSTAINVTANFGQRAFAYTAPSGFKALCTQNLPTPTIGATSTTQANDYFDVKTWSGNSSTQSIPLEFAPDLIWNKNRSGGASNHAWWDVLRGTGAVISSSTTEAETTGYNAITSFSSNAISLGPDNTGVNNGRTNETGRTYVGWVWNAGDSTVTNTSGTISAQVRASTTSGFSIVTYTGNGSAGSTVGHGLGASPSWVITKSRSNATNWMVWTDKLTTNYALEGLNTTGAEVSGGSPSKYIRAVSSTTFTIGDDISVNQSASYTYVAYCFAAVAGYSAFGSYTGNGSSDGPFVYLGFRPAYVMIKYSSGTADWIVLDKSRPGYNVIGGNLYPNSSLVEDTQTKLDLTSNGFKIRADGSNANVNVSSGTYIYAAFAESPFKYSLAR